MLEKKKIITMQYACRKTLADSRPRVRGRFAKNDDFGEAPRASGGHHEEDDEEDVRSSLTLTFITYLQYY